MGKDVEEYEHCMYRSKLASAGRNEKMLYKGLVHRLSFHNFYVKLSNNHALT